MFRCFPGRPLRWRTSPVALSLLLSTALAATGAAQTPALDSTPSATESPLRPGDLVRVTVWREPDLSGDFTVDQAGSVVIPKLGVIPVAGRSPSSVKDSMLRGYATYLRNPSVDVTFLRRITISGAVRNPGLYPVDPSVSITDALALAGGVSGAGRTNRVELIRGGERLVLKIEGGRTSSAAELHSGDHLVVPERSWFSRNPWVVAAAITSVAGILRLAID